MSEPRNIDPHRPPSDGNVFAANRGSGGESPGTADTQLAKQHEAVIARAARRSLAVLVAAGLVVGIGVFWHSWGRAPVAVEAMTVVVPPPQEAPPVTVPRVTFTEVARSWGVAFHHTNAAQGSKLLPETMGGGVAVFDYDNDDRQDLLLIDSCPWPWDLPAAAGPLPTPRLYHNEGQGRFRDVTAGSGLDVPTYGMGVAVGDYDNDGWVDVFITAVALAESAAAGDNAKTPSGPARYVSRNRLFRNLGGGKFRDVTDASGLGMAEPAWSTSCGFFDYDRDGRLDLFVCNYVRWSRSIDLAQGFALTGIGRAYGPPLYFEGTYPYLFHNEGNGRFREVSQQAGLRVTNAATGRPLAKSLGVTFLDLDADGWMDILVANDTVQNFLFHNQRDGTFREIGAQAGIGFDQAGNARGAMGIDAAWFRNDAAVGVAISNFANEMLALYVTQGDPLIFADEAIPAGLGPVTRLDLAFGIFFFDYDLDGRLDMLSANGHVEEEISKVQTGMQYRQPIRLFWNAGDASPVEFLGAGPERSGPDLAFPIVGRGAAYGDLDGDGDLDIVVTQIAGPVRVLRNDLDRRSHFLRLKLVGTRDNRDAIGAVVEVDVAGRTLRRQVMPTRSYLSQVELPVTLGLGEQTQVDAVRVRWPDGTWQKVEKFVLDGLTVLHQQPTSPRH